MRHDRIIAGRARALCTLGVLPLALMALVAYGQEAPGPQSRTESSGVSMEVFPSPAPNVFGSPSWTAYRDNALNAIENGIPAIGDPALTPAAYYRVTVLGDRDNIVTGFPSWRGYADPGTAFGAAFAGELGNRITFGLHILGNGTKIKLSNLSRHMHSSDPDNTFGWTDNFSGASYSDKAIGIDYGPDGIKGTSDDVRITSGPATQAVDEIVYVGGGNAMDTYCPACTGQQQQTAVDSVRAAYASIMPFTFTMDYVLLDDAQDQLAFASGTVFFGTLPFAAPDLACAKTHVGNFLQGDPGSAAGTYITGPVANVTGAWATSAPGFGPSAWQAGGSTKAEFYVPAAALFGHPVKVGDLASVSWWTNKESGISDWYNLIYTVPQNDSKNTGTWYRSRLNSEPYLSGGSYTPGAWKLWSTGDADHPLRYFDALRNGGIYGTYTDPLLSGITSGPVTWANGTSWDYSGEQILSFSMQTGSGWANGFTGMLDGLTVTLKSGETATVNFEAYASTYTITVTDALGAGPTNGNTVTVTDTLPAGLTAVAFSGDGWTTDLTSLTATRTDVLGPGGSYPPLTLKVAVANNAPASVTNVATVSVAGDTNTSNDTASDPAAVIQIPTHLAFTTQPAGGAPGQTLPEVVVQVEDAGNHAVVTFTGNVSLTLAGGTPGAVLTGGSAAAVAGVATFSGLSVDLAGSGYILTASTPNGSGSLTVASTSFDVAIPPCLDPAFVSADAVPYTPNVQAGQTLTLLNRAGSAVPSSFAFTWDAAFTVNAFSADPDGILGFWQVMAPYAGIFAPTASFEVIRKDASSAFVDMNGNGTYDAGTDYDVALSGNTITVSRAVTPGTVESQATGYRLILQDSLFTNPEYQGQYPVVAVLNSSCPSPWTATLGEIMDPSSSGCLPVTEVGATLRVAKSSSQMTISWQAPFPADSCMTGYAVFAASDCTAWSHFTPITGQDLDMDPANTQFAAGDGLDLTFYLVAEVGGGGQVGPVGHYGK